MSTVGGEPFASGFECTNSPSCCLAGRRDAKEAFKTRKLVLPSANFIKTYFSSYSNDPINTAIIPSDSVDPKGFVRAKQALDSGRYEEVIAACTEEMDAGESAKYKLEATLLRGTFHLLCGSPAESLVDLNSIIENPANAVAFRVNAFIKRASLNVQSEQHLKGFEDFEEAEKLDASNADLYHQRGQVYTLLEKFDAALADLTKCCILNPDHCSAYVQKCYVEYRAAAASQNRFEVYRALDAVAESVVKFPNSIECYNVYSQILTEQQQFAEADELFDKAMALAPTQASLYVHRGLLYLQWNGDINKALESLNKAIEIDDKCELAYETLGTIQVQRGLLENAIDLFEKALKLTRSELEMTHLYSLRNAAIAQMNVAKKLGLDLSSLSALSQMPTMP